MFTTQFAKAALERAIKTLAQTLVALLGVNATGILDVDWTGALSAAGLAAIISLLTSVASDKVTGDGPSLTSAEVVPGEQHLPENPYGDELGE